MERKQERLLDDVAKKVYNLSDEAVSTLNEIKEELMRKNVEEIYALTECWDLCKVASRCVRGGYKDYSILRQYQSVIRRAESELKKQVSERGYLRNSPAEKMLKILEGFNHGVPLPESEVLAGIMENCVRGSSSARRKYVWNGAAQAVRTYKTNYNEKGKPRKKLE